MIFSIPSSVSEACNGALLAMLAVAGVFFALYLWRAWREHIAGRRYWGDENRTAVALLGLSFGIGLKTWGAWWALHLRNRGLHGDYPYSGIAFVAGTMVSIWALICLIRSLSRYEWNQSTWLWLAIGAVVWGVVWAL